MQNKKENNKQRIESPNIFQDFTNNYGELQ